ncbi:TrkA C-terminal domain-containing protein [Massilia sp. H-1]|nr:TrkA C-terminal domain-containing protein [Massilia sp. H-1]
MITYANTPSAIKVLHLVHELAPTLPVIVRSHDDTDLDVLKKSKRGRSGAGSARGQPDARLARAGDDGRAAAARGAPRAKRATSAMRPCAVTSTAPATRRRRPEHTYVRLHSVILRDDAGSIGKRIEELELHEVGAEVTTIRRGKERLEVTPRTELQRGDVVVLRGSAEAVDRAEGRLLN